MLYRKRLKESSRIPIVVDALHGFFGSGEDYSPLQEHCEFVMRTWDLVGFGQSKSQASGDFALENQLNHLSLDEGSHLLGYSMGGRLALQWAARFPHRLSSLVLIGAHPGLREGAEKKARQLWDREWSEFFGRSSIDECWSAWATLPLIQTQKEAPGADRRQDHRLRQNPKALAASMLHFGTGVVPDCWDRLEDIEIPVLLIAGAHDTKYTSLVQRMSECLPQSEVWIQPEAGHAPHFEQPEAVGRALNDWYSRLYSSESSR